MCVSLSPAIFDDTAIMISPARHPDTGAAIVVMAYQNKVQNKTRNHGNAMLIHFPASSAMGKKNIIDTDDCPHIVSDMIKSLMPVSRSIPTKGIMRSKSVEIFESGIYTIVMSNDASSIPEALDRVAANKRPVINKNLFNWYGKQFPEWKFALCCFSNRDVADSTPMVWWYEPIIHNKLMLPGIDCHTGDVPDLSSKVDVNHWVIAGSRNKLPDFCAVRYQDNLSPFLQDILPKYVRGKHLTKNMINGDFILPMPSEPENIERGLLTN
jgi:hypothetical protein